LRETFNIQIFQFYLQRANHREPDDGQVQGTDGGLLLPATHRKLSPWQPDAGRQVVLVRAGGHLHLLQLPELPRIKHIRLDEGVREHVQEHIQLVCDVIID